MCISNNNAKVFAASFHCNKAITNRGLHYHLSRAGQGALLRLRAVAQRETSGNDDEMYVYTVLVVDVIVVIVFLSVPV